MKKQFVDFMQKVFVRDHTEPAAPLREGHKCWYDLCFGMYHPCKPDQIEVVFDSSALNNVIFTGPNLNSNFIRVLLYF